jgi:hypothetical protein
MSAHQSVVPRIDMSRGGHRAIDDRAAWPVSWQSLPPLPTREESMKKLKIELDALGVESFETSRLAPEAGGTVRGQEARTLYELSCYCTYPTATQNEEGAAIACGG